MSMILTIARVALAALALARVRWAYFAFIVLGLLYFPQAVGWHPSAQPCELTFNAQLALISFTNYAHIVLCAGFFVMSYVQVRTPGRPAYAWAAVAVLIVGALAELLEGWTGYGHCRSRDLIPDMTGALIGGTLVYGWNSARQALALRIERRVAR